MKLQSCTKGGETNRDTAEYGMGELSFWSRLNRAGAQCMHTVISLLLIGLNQTFLSLQIVPMTIDYTCGWYEVKRWYRWYRVRHDSSHVSYAVWHAGRVRVRPRDRVTHPCARHLSTWLMMYVPRLAWLLSHSGPSAVDGISKHVSATVGDLQIDSQQRQSCCAFWIVLTLICVNRLQFYVKMWQRYASGKLETHESDT